MICAEGETVVIEQGGVRIVFDVNTDPLLPRKFHQAWTVATDARDNRRHDERQRAAVAAWRQKHPDAIEIRPGIWRDGGEVCEGEKTRAPNRGEVSPPMMVRVQGGRVGHLWTGGDILLCGKWVSRSNVTPCDLPMCRTCAEKAS